MVQSERLCCESRWILSRSDLARNGLRGLSPRGGWSGWSPKIRRLEVGLALFTCVTAVARDMESVGYHVRCDFTYTKIPSMFHAKIVFLPVRCVRMNSWVSLNLTFVSGTISILGIS